MPESLAGGEGPAGVVELCERCGPGGYGDLVQRGGRGLVDALVLWHEDLAGVVGGNDVVVVHMDPIRLVVLLVMEDEEVGEVKPKPVVEVVAGRFVEPPSVSFLVGGLRVAVLDLAGLDLNENRCAEVEQIGAIARGGLVCHDLRDPCARERNEVVADVAGHLYRRSPTDFEERATDAGLAKVASLLPGANAHAHLCKFGSIGRNERR